MPPTDAILLYPNPAQDQVVIRMSASARSIPYTLHDAIGRVVLRGILSAPLSVADVSALQSGTYFLRTPAGVTSPLIIQH
ncbi:MAG: T9SS type A sorting domain-containing protein [Flavobacteriales bacterium]|nr:T9SS type A sorting domain-containing protein [Flavobacteriales bacterium]